LGEQIRTESHAHTPTSRLLYARRLLDFHIALIDFAAEWAQTLIQRC
jgi:hypothetical protein